ncbi:helix-turn-helix domain-containing protein [Paenibacillus sp. NPDC058071]|uniref:helix-turn-helix domain-containing protein n=1 Tax=Paenibacillus sp. NPDC058071 TaxID=3346326 RepID=UPI0036D7D93A
MQQQLFHHIFQELEQPMVIVRVTRDVVVFYEVNSAFGRLTGYTGEQLRNKPVKSVIGPYSDRTAARPFKREGALTTARKRIVPVRMENKPLDYGSSENGLTLMQFEDLSAQKWIDRQAELHQVLVSGVVDTTYHIRYLRDTRTRSLLQPEVPLEDETFFQFITESELSRITDLIPETNQIKKLNTIIIRTVELNGIQLELTVSFTPLFDGFGKLKEYAFVILDYKPVNDFIDSATKLKIWMAKRDISANQLSAATNISLQTISKLRNGKIEKPQRLTAELIASELRIDVSEIWPEVRKSR